MSEYLQPSLEGGGLAVVSFLWFLFLFILECLLYFFPWVFFLLFFLSWELLSRQPPALSFSCDSVHYIYKKRN
jgi:hypothetical protein